MEPAVIGAIIGGGGTVIVGLFGLVGVMWRGNNGTGKMVVDFVEAVTDTNTKVDAQHETLRDMLLVQHQTKDAIVEVGTIIKQNGGRT